MAIHPNLHDQDFYAWALGNAALLRDGRLSDIDIARRGGVGEHGEE